MTMKHVISTSFFHCISRTVLYIVLSSASLRCKLHHQSPSRSCVHRVTSMCQHFESVTTLSELGLSFVITNNPNTITPLFGLQMLCCGQLNKNDLLTMCGNIFLKAIGLQNFYHFTAHICSWNSLRGGQVHCLKPSKVLFKVTAAHCLQHLPKAVVPAQLMACMQTVIIFGRISGNGYLANKF